MPAVAVAPWVTSSAFFVIVRRDLRDTAGLAESWGVAMPVRSAAFGTLALLACCFLPPLGCPAYATPEPPRTPHKRAPLAPTEVEVPFFQPGLWEYRRTVTKDDSRGPQFSLLRKCADPSTEIRQKKADLGKRSCHFAPLAHRKGRYISSWTCPTPLGPTSFRAVLITRGAVGYTDVSEMRTRDHIARQRIEAIRIGTCPESGPVTPRTPNFKATPPPEVRG